MPVPVPGPHDLLVRVRACHDLPMELAAALTVWITFGAWLFLPTVNAPARFSRISLWLCGAELVAGAIWSYGSEGCVERPCAPLAETARTAAALDIPLLTGVAIVLGSAHAMRRVGVKALPQRGTSSPARTEESTPPR
jgi:hypothetical protein